MRHNDDDAINATFETVAGTAALIVTAFAAAVMFPAAEPAARVLVVAVTVGVLSARFTDWRACAGVAVIAALVFVGFLAHQYGVLTGEPTPWSFTPLIGFAALLGRGYRRLASSSRIRTDRIPPHLRLRRSALRRCSCGRRRRPLIACRRGRTADVRPPRVMLT